MAKKKAKRKRPATTKGKPEAMDDAFWAEVVAGERCGAKKKNAPGFCRNRPYLVKKDQDGPGPWRCKLHGGVLHDNPGAPKKNQNAVSHGIYSKAMTDDEQELYNDLNPRDVDAPIRMTMIRLKRAFELEFAQDQAIQGDPEADHGMIAMERKVTTTEGADAGDYTERSVTRKRRDYAAIIDRLVGQLTRLVAQKVALEGDGAPDIAKVAQAVRDAIGQARGDAERIQSFATLPLTALGVRNSDLN
jgi:hypothetical protein